MTDDGLSMTTVSFKCPRSLWDKVREYAVKDDRPYSAVIRFALSRLVGGSAKARVPGRPPSNGQQTIKCV